VYGGLGPVFGDAVTETGSVAEVTVWGRALDTCEMDALYYTDGFAIDTSSSASATNASGLSAKLPLPRGARGTFAMWIKPFKAGVQTGQRQTLLAGYRATTGAATSSEPAIDLGLVGESLTLTIRRFPAAAPGAGVAVSEANAKTGGVCGGGVALELTTSVAAVAGGRWSHVAATFDGEYATLLVDGVVVAATRGTQAFRDQAAIVTVATNATAGGGVTALKGENAAETAASYVLAAPFKGLIYDLRVADPPLAAWEVKRDVQCPPVHVTGDPTAAAGGMATPGTSAGGAASTVEGVYVRFNEGAGAIAAGGAVTGIPAGAWVNASSPGSLVREDAPTRLTTFGAARSLLGSSAGAPAAWTIQRRGACGARLRGVDGAAGVSASLTVVGVNGASVYNSTGGFVGYEKLIRALPVESHGGAVQVECSETHSLKAPGGFNP
jgi:hypothetical protein